MVLKGKRGKGKGDGNGNCPLRGGGDRNSLLVGPDDLLRHLRRGGITETSQGY